jgi:diaminopimelate decarboxylase
MLMYQALGVMPRSKHDGTVDADEYLEAIAGAVMKEFGSEEFPELIVEPGRILTSQNGILLVSVHYVKSRSGVGTWLITDGGLGTVTLPTFYEYHEILLCNDVNRPVDRKATITGPACFAGDIIYRNKPMPRVDRGEVLAIMDAGSYFTQLESNFGFARAAVVSVRDGRSRVVRRRESFDDMVMRDDVPLQNRKEESDEICSGTARSR